MTYVTQTNWSSIEIAIKMGLQLPAELVENALNDLLPLIALLANGSKISDFGAAGAVKNLAERVEELEDEVCDLKRALDDAKEEIEEFEENMDGLVEKEVQYKTARLEAEHERTIERYEKAVNQSHEDMVYWRQKAWNAESAK